jgi:hypothetical protein
LIDGSYIAIALRDDTYLLDFIETTSFAPNTQSGNFGRKIIAELWDYSDAHSEKIIGVVLAQTLHSRIPELCPQLWGELDILPILLDKESDTNVIPETVTRVHFERKLVNEQAESLSRECIR